ncbi:MAG: hypothetical protein FWG98_08800 [Candidatus Cloacimonetes bacterium]|nr:hypothetical protein [Candidatus Cloacimonadota bacterium]
MKKINKYFLLFCIILVFSCSSNRQVGRIVEQSGDVSLKEQSDIRINYYIGHAQSYIDFEEAFRNAIIQAQIMIGSELGINVNISTRDISMTLGTATTEDLAYYIHREFHLDSQHNINTRINRIYRENLLLQNTLYYRVWVELFFDIEEFYNRYNQFWTNEINNLRISNQQRISNTFILNFERIISLKERFEDEKRYLNERLVRDFENLYDQYHSFFNTNKQHITVQNISGNHKFSNEFVFLISFENNSSGEVSSLPITQPVGIPSLSDFPVRINNMNYLTNMAGLINYTADYERPIVISVGHNLQGHFQTRDLAIYFNDSFSPTQNRNITVRIDSISDPIKNTFSRNLERKGFRIGDSPDIIIEIIPSINTENFSVNQYISNVKLRLMIRSTISTTMRAIEIPHNRDEFIRGHGQTEVEARANAFSMEWYGRTDAEFDRIEQLIREILIGN